MVLFCSFLLDRLELHVAVCARMIVRATHGRCNHSQYLNNFFYFSFVAGSFYGLERAFSARRRSPAGSLSLPASWPDRSWSTTKQSSTQSRRRKCPRSSERSAEMYSSGVDRTSGTCCCSRLPLIESSVSFCTFSTSLWLYLNYILVTTHLY